MRSKSKVAAKYGIYRVTSVGEDGYSLWLFAQRGAGIRFLERGFKYEVRESQGNL